MHIFKSHQASQNTSSRNFYIANSSDKRFFFVKFLTSILLNYQHIDPTRSKLS